MENTISAKLQVPTSQLGDYFFFPLAGIESDPTRLSALPFSIRVLLEMMLRARAMGLATDENIYSLVQWQPHSANRMDIPFYPGRVVMQDFSGVPVIVDLASMREAAAKSGQDFNKINPVIPVDIVIDHSVQVDYYGRLDALKLNTELEFRRNKERYELLKWAQSAFKNIRVLPPSRGIIHQVNLEFLAHLVQEKNWEGKKILFPETLVGTDSHTTMINGIGIVGWGVGGIEAVAAMLGQPLEIPIPDVIGVKLSGKLPAGTTPTDLTLTITQALRKKGVVNKFVEFFGSGLSELPVADRAMIANMSPENGATITYFPVDRLTLDYLSQTGRSTELVERVRDYYQAQGLYRYDDSPEPQYSDVLEIDLASIEPSLAGPKRPQDRVPVKDLKTTFEEALLAPKAERGFALSPDQLKNISKPSINGQSYSMGHGAVVIAAITSCTNTSNPFVMISAGLLAKKALQKGLKVKPYVKTSLAPGSRVVVDYLAKADLLEPLSKLGFFVVGYGCTTCIGNSGPLNNEVIEAIQKNNLVAAAVLSGNRNFEGRVHPFTLANFLASPPLVVAYALAGTVDIDLNKEPLGLSTTGETVYLKDIWPSTEEVQDLVKESIKPEMFVAQYTTPAAVEIWDNLEISNSPMYPWNPESTYVQNPPYFDENAAFKRIFTKKIEEAKVLAVLGDSITTDHISPAGDIPSDSAAGQYLISKGVSVDEFNTYGSRRGNDQVLTRGTFANIRLKNQLVPGTEGGYTEYFPTHSKMSIFDASVRYQEIGLPLVVLAGKEYGTGSSRDWAAKGALLLGVRAIIAESYERIHRSNLAGMGVLPLQFKEGDSIKSLGLSGKEKFFIQDFAPGMKPRSELSVIAERDDGTKIEFKVIARIDTPVEVKYYAKGGLLPTVLEEMLA